MQDVVRLSLPAKAEYLVTARLVGASLAGNAGFDMEQIEDVKAALSEVCLLLIPCMHQPGCLQMELWVEDGLHAKVCAACSPDACPNTPERQFSMFLLEALADEFKFSYNGDESEYRFYKALPR